MERQAVRDTSAIAYTSSGQVAHPEVQTIVNVRPQYLEAQGYAPVAAKGDRLPLFIGGGLLAALVVIAGIHLTDGDKQKLQAQNAKLEARQDAIAGCIKGVTGQ